jgi:lantibiotic modifying enzyme
MTYKELKQRSVDIDLLEKDLMRDLTEEEKNLIADKGFKAFLADININIDDLRLIKQIRELFGAFFSEDIEKYESLVNKYNTEKVIETLEDVLKDLKKEDSGSCGEVDLVDTYIRRLKAGETLELESEVLEDVIDRLWDKETNIKIEVRNNKIRLR